MRGLVSIQDSDTLRGFDRNLGWVLSRANLNESTRSLLENFQIVSRLSCLLAEEKYEDFIEGSQSHAHEINDELRPLVADLVFRNMYQRHTLTFRFYIALSLHRKSCQTWNRP